MTSRLLYEGLLIELNKVNAPNILLEDFNYFANKAINQYINKRYNIYDINLLTTDDLRVLKATAILKPRRLKTYDALSLVNNKMATYYVDLPSDYLHLLNCICIYNVNKTYKCYNKGETWRAAATRLTADAYSQVLDNFWLRPTYKRPYYYIHNINQLTSDGSTNTNIPTNPYRYVDGTLIGTDSNFTEASDYHGDYDIINTEEDEDNGSDPKTTPEETKLVTVSLSGSDDLYKISYGDNIPDFECIINDPDQVLTIDQQPEISCSASKYSNAGTYKVSINRGSIPNNVNVIFGIKEKPFIIEKIKITAFVKAIKKYVRGEELPKYVYSDLDFLGFVKGQNIEVFKTKPLIFISSEEKQDENGKYYSININNASSDNYYISYSEIGRLYITELEDTETITPTEITLYPAYALYGSVEESIIAISSGNLELYDDNKPRFKVEDLNGIEYTINSELHVGTYNITLNKPNIRGSVEISGTPTLTISPTHLNIYVDNITVELDEPLPEFRFKYNESEFKNGHSYTGRNNIINNNSLTVAIKDGVNTINYIPNTTSVGTYTLELSGSNIIKPEYSGDYDVILNSGTLTVVPDTDKYLIINIEDSSIFYGEASTAITYTKEYTSGSEVTGVPEFYVTYNNTEYTNFSSLPIGEYKLLAHKGSLEVDGSSTFDFTVNSGWLRVKKNIIYIRLKDSDNSISVPLTNNMSFENIYNLSLTFTGFYGGNVEYLIDNTTTSIIDNCKTMVELTDEEGTPFSNNNNLITPLLTPPYDSSINLKNLKIIVKKNTYDNSIVGDYTISFYGLSSNYYEFKYYPFNLKIEDQTFEITPSTEELDLGLSYKEVLVPSGFLKYEKSGTLYSKTYVFDYYYFKDSNYNNYYLEGKDGKVVKHIEGSSLIFVNEDGNPEFVDFIGYEGNVVKGYKVYIFKEQPYLKTTYSVFLDVDGLLLLLEGEYFGNTIISNVYYKVWKKTETIYDKYGNVFYEDGKPKTITLVSLTPKDGYTPNEVGPKDYIVSELNDLLHNYSYLYLKINGESKEIKISINPLGIREYEKVVAITNDDGKIDHFINPDSLVEYTDFKENSNGEIYLVGGIPVKPATTTNTLRYGSPDTTSYYYTALDEDGEGVVENEKGESLKTLIKNNKSYVKFLEIKELGGANSPATTINPYMQVRINGKLNTYIFYNWTITINNKKFLFKAKNTSNGYITENAFYNVLSWEGETFLCDEKVIEDWTIEVDKEDPNYENYTKYKNYYDIKILDNSYIKDKFLEKFGPFYPKKVYIYGFPKPTVEDWSNEVWVNSENWENSNEFKALSSEKKKSVREYKKWAGLSEYEKTFKIYRLAPSTPTRDSVKFGYWKRNPDTWKILSTEGSSTTGMLDGLGLELKVFKPSTFVEIENFPPSLYRCKQPGAEVLYYFTLDVKDVIDGNEIIIYKKNSFVPDYILNSSLYASWKSLGIITNSTKPYPKPEDYGWNWRWNDNSSGKWCDICGYWKYLTDSYPDSFVKSGNCYKFKTTLTIIDEDCDCSETTLLFSPATGLPSDSSSDSSSDSDSNNRISIVQGITPPNFILTGDKAISNVERGQGIRYGNVSRVRLEIRYGTDSSIFSLDYEQGKPGGLIYIDYLKAPQHIRLTLYELDLTEDTSQVLEYPDYVCQEIINELTHIVMENLGDPKLQTHPVVSLSIANPAQTLAPEAAGQSAQ